MSLKLGNWATYIAYWAVTDNLECVSTAYLKKSPKEWIFFICAKGKITGAKRKFKNQ